jgi:hypothetical protein
MPIYKTIFDDIVPGGTAEIYEIEITHGEDLTGTGFHDIKVKLTLAPGSRSGTEDSIGVAFDLNNLGNYPGLQIVGTRVLEGATTFTAEFDIDEDAVTGNVGQLGIGQGGGAVPAAPFDAWVKISDNGSGDGIVQSFEFILTDPDRDLDAGELLNGSDWYIRTQSTDGGGGSSKTLGTIAEVCFAAGTLIATPDGERAVETLAIGAPVLTADGRIVPVRWIGRQTLHKLFTPAERFCPVRVRAGALGGGLPHTDLVLTADHALILDGLAICAGALVNGTTIVRDPAESLPDRVTYYHVETAGHEAIRANGAAAETYVDYVQRRAFDNHADYLALYGEERTIPEMDLPRISAARLVPPALRARLAAVAAA